MTADSLSDSFALIDTPALLVDEVVVEANIRRMSAVTSSLGIDLRPHIKTHKLPQLALRQQEAGSVGVTVARLEEAEAMVDVGIRDVFLAYPIVDPRKLARARVLSERVHLTLAIEDLDSARWLDHEMMTSHGSMDVMLEIDTGHRRCGVTSVEAATEVATGIAKLSSLSLRGIFTHEGQAYAASSPEEAALIGQQAGHMMRDVADAIRGVGLELPSVSVGCSLTVESAGADTRVTEARPGTYVFNDRSQVLHGRVSWADCAAHVLASVVSLPEPGRAVIDTGSKSLGLDRTLISPPRPGYGQIVGHPDWLVDRLSEEHGVLTAQPDAGVLRVGDRLRIIPNHVCPVVNLFDEVVIHRAGEVVSMPPTTGRSRRQWLDQRTNPS